MLVWYKIQGIRKKSGGGAIPSLGKEEEGVYESWQIYCLYKPLPATSQSTTPLPREGIKKLSERDD